MQSYFSGKGPQFYNWGWTGFHGPIEPHISLPYAHVLNAPVYSYYRSMESCSTIKRKNHNLAHQKPEYFFTQRLWISFEREGSTKGGAPLWAGPPLSW